MAKLNGTDRLYNIPSLWSFCPNPIDFELERPGVLVTEQEPNRIHLLRIDRTSIPNDPTERSGHEFLEWYADFNPLFFLRTYPKT